MNPSHGYDRSLGVKHPFRAWIKNVSSRTSFVLIFSILLLSLPVQPSVASDASFECGGSVEKEVWALWDTQVRDFLEKNLLQERLLKRGDVYALYDFQTYTHNMVAMARRCHKVERLREVARMIHEAYGALEQVSPSSSRRQWVCKGGAICNDKNRLLNREVMLCSVQFLGLAASVANALVSVGNHSEEDRAFVRETVQVLTEHLLRWGDDGAIKSMRKATAARPQDVKGGSSALFFTDKPLWLITIYAELSGILQSPDIRDATFDGLSIEEKARMREHVKTLLAFFNARISIHPATEGRRKIAAFADLDRGYWRLYADNRYAGYEGDSKPVSCRKDDRGNYTMQVHIAAKSVPKREDIGWDISHARRLVHALDALERNRSAMKEAFSLTDGQLPPENITTLFANAFVETIWNGDKDQPLFANYWCGANGWYRVAYDNGTGQCREGSPPYGLTNSFPTGGYITWGRFNPIIGELGHRLYTWVSTPEGEKSPFIIKYYPSLSNKASTQTRARERFMFLPSLITKGEEGKR